MSICLRSYLETSRIKSLNQKSIRRMKKYYQNFTTKVFTSAFITLIHNLFKIVKNKKFNKLFKIFLIH